MRPLIMKGKERYIRLFSVFESELIKYNKVFEKEHYILTYVIGKSILSKDYDIGVTLSIMKNPLWTRYFDEPRNLKQLFQLYCNYFSIKDIKIVRPFKRVYRKAVSPIQRLPLEDRICFEFFKHQQPDDFLDQP
jgi:hypothetical protein